jgi:putative oxidoreductase
MDLGLLLLRLALGLLLTGHGLQKAFGWFHGPGVTAAAELFESWGFYPGRPMVVLAASCEILAGVLLILGLGTPLAAAITIGTMVVAAAPNAANGLWAARGGVELPLVYVLLGIVLALTGPGALSLDDRLSITLPGWAGVVAIAVGLLASTVPLLRRHAPSPDPHPRRDVGTTPGGTTPS